MLHTKLFGVYNTDTKQWWMVNGYYEDDNFPFNQITYIILSKFDTDI